MALRNNVLKIYNPKSISEQSVNELTDFEKGQIRFFSLARYALVEGLKSLNLEPTDKILIPSFICRDVLSSMHIANVKVTYYNVDEQLDPLDLPVDESIKAVLMVNFFGFSQKLETFKKYCLDNACILIEDNAHGFLSTDEQGALLGTRADFGIFSLRKTVPIQNGAILYLNRNSDLKLADQIAYSGPCSVTKLRLRNMIHFIRPSGIQLMTRLIRTIRKIRTGNEVPLSGIEGESQINESPNPVAVNEVISKINFHQEVERRRSLFLDIDTLLSSSQIKPIWRELPTGCSPFGYPFRCDEEEINKVKIKLKKNGLECFKWPDLPEAVVQSAPEHYKNVWVVRMMW